MTTISTEEQLQRLNERLAQYQILSRKSWPDTLAKQGGKLGYELKFLLRGIAPGQGEVRAELVERLRAGGGIRVGKTARKFADTRTIATTSNIRTRKAGHFQQVSKIGNLKTGGLNWWQLAVKREINIRESGRGFLSITGNYPRVLNRVNVARSKYGPTVSKFGITASTDGATARLEWNPADSELAALAAEGLAKPRARAITALALRNVADDIGVYVARKADELKVTAGLN